MGWSTNLNWCRISFINSNFDTFFLEFILLRQVTVVVAYAFLALVLRKLRKTPFRSHLFRAGSCMTFDPGRKLSKVFGGYPKISQFWRWLLMVPKGIFPCIYIYIVFFLKEAWNSKRFRKLQGSFWLIKPKSALLKGPPSQNMPKPVT